MITKTLVKKKINNQRDPISYWRLPTPQKKINWNNIGPTSDCILQTPDARQTFATNIEWFFVNGPQAQT